MPNTLKKFAIIGGGAAGVFCASAIGRREDIETSIYESSSKPLQKVLLTGGGRCNFTNVAVSGNNPKDFYPRGASFLRKSLRRFNAEKAVEFFEKIGVKSIEEPDGRIFPFSEKSSDIADALVKSSEKNGAKILCGIRAKKFEKVGDSYEITFLDRTSSAVRISADFVLFAIGGAWDTELKKSLEKAGHTFAEPLPSLFSLKLDSATLPEWNGLSGACAQNAQISADLGGDKISSKGSLLLTHFGIGGPCTLKFSSFGAKHMASVDYKFPLKINFIAAETDSSRAEAFQSIRKNEPKKLIKNTPLFGLPKAVWEFAISCAKVDSQKYWAKFSAEDEKKLCSVLTSFGANCIGRSSHADEFVTCGGINTEEVEPSTSQSRILENVYFAGECLDIDGITGGFNLHAAWTTALNCAENIIKKLDSAATE